MGERLIPEEDPLVCWAAQAVNLGGGQVCYSGYFHC